MPLMKSTNSHIQVYCNNNLPQGKLTLKTYRKHTLVEAMVENLSISNTYGRCRVSKLKLLLLVPKNFCSFPSPFSKQTKRENIQQ